MNVAILLAFGAMIFWGLDDFFIQRLTRRIGDIETLVWIGIVGSICLAPFAIPQLSVVTPRGWFWLIILGVATFISALYDFEALKIGKIAVIDMVLTLELPLTVVLSIIFLNEKLSVWQIIIMLFVMWGVSLISLGEERKKFTFERGVWLAIIAAMLLAFVNFLTALSAVETTPFLAVWVPWVLFTIFCLIVIIKRRKWQEFTNHFHTQLPLIFWTGVCDVVAWICYANALTISGLGIITAITESYPVIALLLGLWINRERLVSRQYFGAALAFIGSIVLAFSIG